jgi:hypothetical protein
MRALKLFILILTLPFSLSVCTNACGEKLKRANDKPDTPEKVVAEMLDALKSEDWEKAVSYIDVQGIISEAKSFLTNNSANLTTAEKELLQKELEGLTEEKVRENFISNIKEVFGNDFSYKITGISMRDEKRSVVFVELSRNGKKKNDSIPLIKIEEKWMISYRGLVRFDKTNGRE